MRGLGLLAESETVPINLPPGTGTGTKVVILGAGIGGLVAAYNSGRPASTARCSKRAGGQAAARGPFVRARRSN